MTIWYLARATGFVALIAFTVSTALGALSSASRNRRSPAQLDRRLLQQMAHRSAAVLGLIMLLVHTTLIVVDSFVDVTLSNVFIPFTAGYRPLALGLGTFAVYFLISAAVSGAMRGRLASSPDATAGWRAVHVFAYIGWGLSMAHGIFAGTDTGRGWTTVIYAACGLTIALAVAIRVRSEIQRRSEGLGAARNHLRHRGITT